MASKRRRETAPSGAPTPVSEHHTPTEHILLQPPMRKTTKAQSPSLGLGPIDLADAPETLNSRHRVLSPHLEARTLEDIVLANEAGPSPADQNQLVAAVASGTQTSRIELENARTSTAN